jgi:putative tricarboxylic transport membrane protein
MIAGFAAAFHLENLLWALGAAFISTIVGILPGLGPGATIAMLLPLTFYMKPEVGLILLAGIWFGAQYGGSTTSILLNIPGETASVVTCFDGYPMARQGKAALALALSAVGSFMAGTIGLIILSVAMIPLANFGLAFGPPELCVLMLLALIIAGSFGASLPRNILACVFGLLLSTVGADAISGINRFTFHIFYLYEGIDFISVTVGFFAITEVISYVIYRGKEDNTPLDLPKLSVRSLIYVPELFKYWAAMVRGSLLGFFLGLFPGVGTSTATFIAYNVEKVISKHPEKFGHGAPEGVASPEAANNSAVIGAYLPMFALGIPGTAASAMMLMGLTMWGMQPGPMLMVEHPVFVWTVIGSLYLANFALLLINLPGASLLAQFTRVPMHLLMPVVLALSLTGAFFSTNNVFGPIVAIICGFLGFLFQRTGIPVPSMIIGLVLGRSIERNLRLSLGLSHGDWSIFFTRPLSVAILIVGVALIIASVYFRRRQAGQSIAG